MATVAARRRGLVSLWFLFVLVVVRLEAAGAQRSRSAPRATTDPTEARALNSVFQKWGLSANSNQWNISGELCSGTAVDSTQITSMDPGIKCDCTANNGSTCYITALQIYALDVIGPLPNELWNLTHLVDLNLAQNYITGSIPSLVANLKQVQYLSFSINALSGPIPSELGLLSNLISLGISGNNFSGLLPPQLGNLSKLQQLYFDSSGVSGAIPETFANLKSMTVLWGSDNDLVGALPAFIGNWPGLNHLRMQGNSFHGPIPSSFSNLTLLISLRLSEVQNISSSLDFLENLTSLSTLILRNNNITGVIPTFFNRFQSLNMLDLSFNNLTGSIPDNLFNHGTLTNLFLGKNSLSGVLPSQKSDSLINIDLSYNELSGSFPSWVNGPKLLQLNFVANNFTVDSSNVSSLPSGLKCLQRNFPCNQSLYSSFAIKCGGGQVKSTNNILFESDNETLGPSTYYMTGKWAVSNVGLPTDSSNPGYTYSSASPFPNTLDSMLFTTARISAGSLRYYGLSMENGNYNVMMQFSEIVIQNDKTWKALGRRLFDIYIQGELKVKDFDIRKEGGASLRAVARQFTADVVDNHLEIHLFWSGKGTCCIPSPSTYGPLISALSVTPNFSPKFSNNPLGRESNRSRTGLIGGVVGGVVAAIVLLVFAVLFVLHRKKLRNYEDDELLGILARPYMFKYAELKAATDDFNPVNKLGQGAYGAVYKGTLSDGREVAVKQLLVATDHGKSQFIAEIASISSVLHRNLVKLYGCCIEGDKRLLVYEYLENKSLDQMLFKERSKGMYLNWTARYEICLGVARGLAYLHEESHVRIIHRDVKPSNILLDSQLIPKIADFGLAKLFHDKKTHITTKFAGTYGYVSPEYALFGHLTEMADVFSFGIVALVTISGRSSSEKDDRSYLLNLAWDLHESNRLIELVDPILQEYDTEEAKRIIYVAFLCTQSSANLRPAMSRVVAMLSGEIDVPVVTSRPKFLTEMAFKDGSTSAGSLDTSIHAGGTPDTHF